ncbi:MULTISPECIES: HAD family hydrolase [Dickeya]|uniref:HAD family phosphatase n=3 Tax=Dickeya TaxID=204037 RepID=A0A3N0FR54_9GAMM|nr:MULTISPECIES: HAD family phosphatase [Dickeya]MCA6992204.1 HAD family phosphatase [Dickeya oryzae]RNM02576.1 HAD family phosphatase [Dickeya undicola]
MIKAIIFDMDGVLIEAKDWHYDALNRALNLFGYNISRYDHLTKFDGLPTKDKLNMLSKEYSLPSELHSFINEMKQHYTMEIVHTHCKPMFIHQYALSKLKSEGYKLAVASNSIKNSVVTMMEKACLSDYLDIMLSNEDVRKGKPDPEIYITAINKLGVLPSECVVVEDNENGIRAALAAGANVLTVDEVTDVNYKNIKNFILKTEGGR